MRKLKLKNAKSLVEESSYYWKGKPKVFLPSEKLDPIKPIAIDLFSGVGGLSIGFEMAGFQTALGLDIHVPSVETFKASHPNAAVILGDIKKIIDLTDKNENNIIVETTRKVVGDREIDVLMAGIPCQGFSLSNRKRSVLDERNYLFLYFMEAAKALKPKYLLIENVSGLKSLNNGSFVMDIKKAMRSLGYDVDHRFLNAADFGVPQTRRRVFFMGARSGYPIVWPKEKFGKGLKPHRTVMDAIGDLPKLLHGESKTEYSETKEISEYQKLMRSEQSELKNHKAPKHPRETIKKIKETKQGEPMYEKYKQRIRLHWDLPSPTQISGGIRPQFQFGHPEQPRGLTVRERCRIQSIPDNVEVFGGVVQGRVQTGNAVPPLLSKAIGECIMIGLKGETHAKPNQLSRYFNNTSKQG